MYQQTTAIIALAELYAISGDRNLRLPVEDACIWLVQAQNPDFGGWRYEYQEGVSDTSVTGFALFALETARLAGIRVIVDEAYPLAGIWLERITAEVNGNWKTGYDSPGSNNARLRNSQEFDHNPCMDGAHGMARLMFGESIDDDDMLKSFRDVILKQDYLPCWKKDRIDTQYWWWASLFLRQLGEETWRDWREALEKALLDHQRGFRKEDIKAGRTNRSKMDEYGSWDPVGAWGGAGGRVYSTAMGVILLAMGWR
ncbi:MAG: hypothetical protein KDB90_14930 [Planctomycetes bacterium]|nr:hypothetical protein [Planctomycetota bacterium]